MKTFIKIILFFLFSNSVYAYCDFEFVKMERTLKEFSSKITFIHENEGLGSRPNTFFVPSEEICNDANYKMFPIGYTFLNNQLHQIFLEDIFTDIDHLENLSYYYGKPTEQYEDQGTSGMNFYHWDLGFKHVFLVIKFTPSESIKNIEIVTTKYPTLMEKNNEELEE